MLKELLTPAFLVGAAVAFMSSAEAIVYPLEFNAATGVLDLSATPVEGGDGIAVSGSILNQTGLPYNNTVIFTAGSGVVGLSSAAAWFNLPPFGNSLSYQLRDATDTVLASSAAPPQFEADGVIHTGLNFFGLNPGDAYKLVISGTIFSEGNYDLKVGFVTPIPGALLLLAPALAGLGYVGYRRRQTA